MRPTKAAPTPQSPGADDPRSALYLTPPPPPSRILIPPPSLSSTRSGTLLKKLRQENNRLRQETEDQKGIIASLEHRIMELTETLTAVDPDSIAALQESALLTGNEKYNKAVAMYSKLREKHIATLEELKALK